MPLTSNPKPATLRRRARQAQVLAGTVENPRHGDPYWARNWGCGCLTCKAALSKLNHEQYIARKAAEAAQHEGEENA